MRMLRKRDKPESWAAQWSIENRKQNKTVGRWIANAVVVREK